MEEVKICDYGCGKESRFQLKNGKWCCEKYYNKCPSMKNKISKFLTGRKCRKGKKIIEDENIKCDYGCGEVAKYFLSRSKKFCCSETFGGCKISRKQNSIRMKKSWSDLTTGHHSEHRKQKRSDYMKNGGAQRLNTEEHRKNTSIRLKDKTWVELYGKRKSRKMKKKLGEKSKQRMLNGGAAYSLSFIKKTSKTQIELYNRIKDLYPTAIMNYPCLNYSLDIVIPELKICIESDGSWWHQNKERDKKRQNDIEKEGWKVMRYEINILSQVPSKEKIFQDIKNIFIKENNTWIS